MKPKFTIPMEVSRVTETLKNANFEAFLVGGCVRDLFLGRKPKDWDVTTNASPGEIQKLFPDSFYENEYGTVGIKNETDDRTLQVIEVTPYREEATYSDKRHPDAVKFTASLEKDLERRDFTINAIAYDIEKDEIIDPYKGQNDIKDKTIRAVGDPDKRFEEDALRLLRAVRLQAELGFSLDQKTEKALKNKANLIKYVSFERVRDEFVKIINSPNPMGALVVSHETGLLKHFLPELEEGIGVEQGGTHAYDVFTHLLRALQYTASKDMAFHVKLAALLHDIAKPRTRGKGKHKEYSFYGHEVVGAKMARKILERLKFSRETTETVTKLVRWHMFFADPDQITPSAARRLVAKVGPDLVWDLMKLREADRIGTGRPKANPYRLRKYKAMIEEVMTDPVSVGMLKIDGNDLIKEFHMKPGPRIGWILHALLEEVLENPKLNTKEDLSKRVEQLMDMPDEELRKLGEAGKEAKDEAEGEKVAEIRKKHGVQ